MNRGVRILTWGTRPPAMLAYYGMQRLMEKDPDHWLIRGLEGLAGRGSSWVRR